MSRNKGIAVSNSTFTVISSPPSLLGDAALVGGGVNASSLATSSSASVGIPPLSLSTSSRGAGTASSVDRKLLHLVRKIVSSSSNNNTNDTTSKKHPNADTILQTLREQHREYQRKDASLLRKQVEAALQQIQSNSAATTTAAPSSSPAGDALQDRKRKQRPVSSSKRRPSSSSKTEQEKNDKSSSKDKGTEEGKEEKSDSNDNDGDYDKAAAQHDALRQALVANGGGGDGGLNASLRTRYRKIQQSRDAQEAAKAAAAAVLQEEQQAQEDIAATTAPATPSVQHKTSISRQSSNAAGGESQSEGVEMEDDDNNNNVEEDEKVPAASAAAETTPGAKTKGKKRKLKNRSGTSGARERRRMSSSSSAAAALLNSSGGAGDGGTGTDFNIPLVDPSPKERYRDLGGMNDIIQEMRQLVEYPLLRPELYRHLGVSPPRGVLLRGPPGVGKTHLANAVAGELSRDNMSNGEGESGSGTGTSGVAYFRVAAPELVSSMSGDSESRIRSLFQAASDMAPSLIFMDELDAIAPKRNDNAGGGRGMEKRMVAQLLTCMDMVAPINNRNQAAVLVLGATNRPDALDPALRRAGRFDKEILLSVPDEAARCGILKTMTQGMRLMTTNTTVDLSTPLSTTTSSSSDSNGFDFQVLARKTPGFVGADLQSLAKEAAVVAINRIFRDVLGNSSNHVHQIDNATTSVSTALTVSAEKSEEETATSTTTRAPIVPLTTKQMDPLYVTMQDFLTAIPLVQPSSKREGFATVPDVSWDDIGALKAIREELTISVLEPIRHPEKFQALGLPIPAGCMLYGPPGCGKTLLAKAIAHESGANFISVKGPELLDKYVGESERAVRLVFERARSSSPCIVFFDELDSLVPRRGGTGGGTDSGGGVSERVVNQLLTEMDGVTARKSVFCIAATNRPELIDPAMMRPGRLDKLLYVPLPTPEDRVAILRAQSKHMKLDSDVDLHAIGTSPRANGYSGADCTALLREAGLAVLKEDAATAATSTESLCIQARHFEQAFASVSPSVSKKDEARYDRIKNRMARARSRSVDATAAAAQDDDVPPGGADGGKVAADATNSTIS